MLKQLIIKISFLFLLFISCKEEKTKTFNDFQRLVTDTSKSQTNFNEIDIIGNMTSMLNLPIIDKGVDSFELRIWKTEPFSKNSLNILKYNQGKWRSLKYLFYYGYDTGLDSMKVYTVQTPNEINKIIAYLKQREILELPSQIAIPDFSDGIRDGQTFIIEMSTRTFYKLLRYHSPESYLNEPSNVKFMNLIKFLDPYFKFYKF